MNVYCAAHLSIRDMLNQTLIACEQGGMSNEMYNVLARVTDGLYEGIAIGGDVYPGSTLSDHVLRFNNIPQVQFAVYELYICSSWFEVYLSDSESSN
jgi:hypothetical protein